MFFHHHDLTTALHSKLNGSLADQWLKAATQVNAQHLAEELLLLDIEEQAARFVELDLVAQRELVECFSPQDLAAIIQQLRPIAQRRLLRQLSLNKLAQVFGQLPLHTRNTALRHLNRAKQTRFWQYRKTWHRPFSYDRNVSALTIETSVADAIDYYYSDAHQSHYLYLVDQQGILCGMLSGRTLSNIRVKSAPLGLFMYKPRELLVADHDADFVAGCLSKHQVAELPVVNQALQLLGVVDIDDLG